MTIKRQQRYSRINMYEVVNLWFDGGVALKADHLHLQWKPANKLVHRPHLNDRNKARHDKRQ